MTFNISETPRRKVFVSYQHVDQYYKDLFIDMMGDDIVNKSVGSGDIDDGQSVDRTRLEIREGFIRQASVTVVLIGPCTWQRKHVDWEISYSLTTSAIKPTRNGLLGVLLPNHPENGLSDLNKRLMPPRFADNCLLDPPYAHVYNWSSHAQTVKSWIDDAFDRRSKINPTNSRQQFARNRSGDCRRGWSD